MAGRAGFKKVDFLGSNLSRAGIGKQVFAAKNIDIVERVFEAELSEEINALVRPIYVKQRTLMIEVTHPAASEEIRQREEALMAKINEGIGAAEVVRIQFRMPQQEGIEVTQD